MLSKHLNGGKIDKVTLSCKPFSYLTLEVFLIYVFLATSYYYIMFQNKKLLPNPK